MHERDDDYLQAPEVMTIEPEITGEKQHNLRSQYFDAACTYSRKLICLFLSKKQYVVLAQLLCFYLDRRMRLVKVHRAIFFKVFFYVASYIANNTEKRKQFNYDDVKKAFYKLINNALDGKTIKNLARRTDIRLLNYMDKARKLAVKPHFVNLRVFHGQVALPEVQVEAAAA